MSPRLEREAAQDDVMEWSASPEYAERFGRERFPDHRAPASHVPSHVLATAQPATNREALDGPLWLDLPTDGVAFERRAS